MKTRFFVNRMELKNIFNDDNYKVSDYGTRAGGAVTYGSRCNAGGGGVIINRVVSVISRRQGTAVKTFLSPVIQPRLGSV